MFSQTYRKQGMEGFSTGNMTKEYNELIQLVESFSLEHLELDEEKMKDVWEPNVLKIAQIYGNKDLNIGLIFVSKGRYPFFISFVDLHDHPGMVVTSKLIKGKVVRYAMDVIHRKYPTSLDIEDFSKKKQV